MPRNNLAKIRSCSPSPLSLSRRKRGTSNAISLPTQICTYKNTQIFHCESISSVIVFHNHRRRLWGEILTYTYIIYINTYIWYLWKLSANSIRIYAYIYYVYISVIYVINRVYKAITKYVCFTFWYIVLLDRSLRCFLYNSFSVNKYYMCIEISSLSV